MSGTGGLTNVPPFSPEYRASGLQLHVTSRLMVSAIWDRRPFHGSIAFMMLAKDGGRRYHSARPVMETRPINRSRRLRATAC